MRKLYDAGIWPITMATTILKPGGYQRFHQIAGALADIDYTPWTGVDPARAAALVESIPADGHYRKPMKPIPQPQAGAEGAPHRLLHRPPAGTAAPSTRTSPPT